jgi:hypothetical protein
MTNRLFLNCGSRMYKPRERLNETLGTTYLLGYNTYYLKCDDGAL